MATLGHGKKKVPKTDETSRKSAESLYVFPRDEKYPIGDLYHAKLALSGIYAMSGHTKPRVRQKILRSVAKEYPQYNWASYWDSHIKRPSSKQKGLYPLLDWDSSIGLAKKAKRTQKKMRQRQNPAALKLPRGHRMVKTLSGATYKNGKQKTGSRTHILQRLTGGTLCGAGVNGVVPATQKHNEITCYRCAKMFLIEQGEDIGRNLKGKKRSLHMMIPGGYQGRDMRNSKPSKYPAGEPEFLGGTLDHPTQTRLLTKRQRAKRKADLQKGYARLSSKKVDRKGRRVANPSPSLKAYEKSLTPRQMRKVLEQAGDAPSAVSAMPRTPAGTRYWDVESGRGAEYRYSLKKRKDGYVVVFKKLKSKQKAMYISSTGQATKKATVYRLQREAGKAMTQHISKGRFARYNPKS
jgi:hypothetical protein